MLTPVNKLGGTNHCLPRQKDASTPMKIVPLNTWQYAFHGSIWRRKERQVHWRIQSFGTLALGCFRARLSPRGGAKLWHVAECDRYPWILGQFNDRGAFKDSKWIFLFFAHAVAMPVSVCGCAIQKSYFILAFVFARTNSTVCQVDTCYWSSTPLCTSNFRMTLHRVINNFSRNIVIGTRYFVTQTGQHGVATLWYIDTTRGGSRFLEKGGSNIFGVPM